MSAHESMAAPKLPIAHLMDGWKRPFWVSGVNLKNMGVSVMAFVTIHAYSTVCILLCVAVKNPIL